MRGWLFALPLIAIVGCGEPTGLEPGMSAPPVRLEPLNQPGKSVNLSQFKGKAILLDFWATWCGPCRQIMPLVQHLHDKYGAKDLAVVGITEEERSTVEQFRYKEPYNYPVYLDKGGAVGKTYQISALPTFVLIDRNGKIVWKGFPDSAEVIQANLDKALGK